MNVPQLRSEELAPELVDAALRDYGGFALQVHEHQLPWRQALAAAHQLFALERAAKADLAIERSPHFRGWSEMHNQRDWREQLHLGREQPPGGEEPAYRRLQGPNLWPPAVAWRQSISDYMEAVAQVGESILQLAAAALGVDPSPFVGLARHGYLVMKLIGYHPQMTDATPRPGVAPHVDFSWLTLTLQDSAGLEVRTPRGAWVLIEPRPATLWVHAGELLELATRHRYRAVPHRVVNRSLQRTRVSIPLFLNPPLDAEVPVFATLPAAPRQADAEHVHRVLLPSTVEMPLHFGGNEWRRKGRGGWCAVCAPLPSED